MGGRAEMVAAATANGGHQQQQQAADSARRRAMAAEGGGGSGRGGAKTASAANDDNDNENDIGDEAPGSSAILAPGASSQYDVEHLATFSTASSHAEAQPLAAGSNHSDGEQSDELRAGVTNLNRLNNGQRRRRRQQQQGVAEPRVALERLFELEKLSGIWTQQMQIELRDDLMLVRDCETNSIVERFARNLVSRPEAFNHYNDIYHNIIVFTIDQPAAAAAASDKAPASGDEFAPAAGAEDCDRARATTQGAGELHIFQCVSHKAKQLVADILAWKARDPERPSAADAREEADVGGEEAASEEQPQATTTSNDNEMIVSKKTAAPKGETATRQQQAADSAKTTKTSKQAGSSASSEEARPKTTTNGACDMPASKASTASGAPPPTTPGDAPAAKPLVVTVASSAAPGENVPIVNVNVKETVQVFNQIAALREKGSSTGASGAQAAQAIGAARPVSSDASLSSAGVQAVGETGASARASAATTGSALSPGGQFYKQRSIRATLAPKVAPAGAESEQQRPHDSTSSAASSTASSELQNGGGGAGAKPLATTSSSSISAGSSSSRSERDGAGGQPVSMAPGAARHHHRHERNGATCGVKISADVHSNGSLAYTQSNSSSSASSAGHQRAQQQQQPAGQLHNGELKAAARPSNGHNGNSLNYNGPHNHHHHHRHHHHHHRQQQQQQRHSSDSSQRSRGSPSSQQSLSQQLEQVTTNESYVSVLNHCFDDIEKFIIRLQHAYAAVRELQARRRQSRKSSQQLALAAPAGGGGGGQPPANGHHQRHKAQQPPDSGGGGGLQEQQQQQQQLQPLTASELAMLSARARGPSADDFFEILSKFKLAFNLLAKLKGCIHEPNAPELVHFLFTPLAIIIESARNVAPPVDPTVVGIPYLNKDALELLSNCCTSKESDLWLSLGPNWTQTIEPALLKASRLPSSFQPIFSDGWAPVISELELIGLVADPSARHQQHQLELEHYRSAARAICAPPPSSSAIERPDSPDIDNAGAESALQNAGRKAHHHKQPAREPGAHLMMVAGKQPHHKRRGSPAGQYAAGQFVPAEQPAGGHKSPYGPAGYGLQKGAGAAPIDALDQQMGAYRAAKAGGAANQRAARHSMPKGGGGGGDKQLAAGSRRNSDYPTPMNGGHYEAGHFAGPPPLPATNDGYPSNYASNPSDGYTELRDDHLAPGPSAARWRPAADTYHQHGYEPALAGPYGRPLDRYQLHDEAELDEVGPPAAAGYPQYALDEAEREAMLLDLGPAQTEWFYELAARGALIVRVLFTRDANNDKELTVKRGELLEVLDDSRKWWKARNIDLQVAYVPHTIVAVMEHYQTLDELLTNSPGDLMLAGGGGGGDDHQALMRGSQQRYARQPQAVGNGGRLAMNDFNGAHYGPREEKRNSKTARGAFRYF